MKYLHLIPALLAVCSLTACAGNTTPDELFDSFCNEPHAECVRVPKLLLKLGTTFAAVDADDREERQALKLASKLSSVRVLDLDDCAPVVKQRFAEETANLEDKGYETLISVNDEGEKVRICLRRENDYITELLIVNRSDDDASMVQLKGKIKESEIGNLVKADFD